MTLTIDLSSIQASIDNYNLYRRKAREASAAYSHDRDDKKLKRESDRAAKDYANASMSLGWAFASVLKAAGVDIDG